MKIRLGYELIYVCPQPTPMILMLNVHWSRRHDLLSWDTIQTDPPTEVHIYFDSFGNACGRLIAPAGALRIFSQTLIYDAGQTDRYNPSAPQCQIQDLPDETLLYLMGSRYCETDKLSIIAWQLFQFAPTGWGRVQAICDFVHRHITFGYQHARPTKTAFEVFHERHGVCRDFAHLAITLCRCMNIPARNCTGYLTDIGVPPPYGPMDFAGWFEAYLGDDWYTFDARNNVPRRGRILIARGRDAADVPISVNFGENILIKFFVEAGEVQEQVSTHYAY